MGIFQDRLIVRSEIAMLLCPICIGAAVVGAAYLIWGGTPLRVAIGVLQVIGLILLVGMVLPPSRGQKEFASQPDRDARIQVVGSRRGLAYVNAHPMLIAEPELFVLCFALPKHSWYTRMWLAAICFAVFGSFYAAWPQDKFPERTALGASASILVLVSLFAWPAYARVSPGRLDLFQCGFLGRTMSLVRSIDLSRANIRVDLSRRRVFFKEPGSRLVWIDTGFSRFRLAIERAIIAAAISADAPQPLPDDALSG